MKEKIKLGVIGLGNRGTHMIKNIFGEMYDVEIVMICDLVQEKVTTIQKYFAEEKSLLSVEQQTGMM